MLLSAVFKYMAKQSADCRNMTVTVKGCVLILCMYTVNVF